jgi:hypothetical protein
MPTSSPRILLILDDREFASEEVRSIVGPRRFGDIIFKRRKLVDHFRDALPKWAASGLTHLRTGEDLQNLRQLVEASGEDTAAFIIAGRAGFPDLSRLAQLIERLPYAEENFTDRLYKPMLVFLRDAHQLTAQWSDFEAAPMHTWERAWQDSLRVQSVLPLDLANIKDFLTFTSGSTATRHFNEVQMDAYYYTKSSTDKRKMLAEYSFYGLVPETMRPWLIQPFSYRDEGERASYKMMRYYLADAALQWVHGAFDKDSFTAFVDRLLFFMSDRARKACSKAESSAIAHELFVGKLESRVSQFLAMNEGQSINRLASSANPLLAIEQQLQRYRKLFQRHEKAFATEHLAVGHGDPCLSNVLYDQQRHLMKLIDPKGATSEAELWTHPLYDLCKVSHSILGDYDFINNGLYEVGFSDNNDLVLRFGHSNHPTLKPIFQKAVKALGHDNRIMRLGEASLFLSMLPLHIDYPNKVIAFLLKAKHILDEVEGE